MIKRLICMLLVLTLMFSLPVNATKSISPEPIFDDIFEETLTNELYLYNILDANYLKNRDYILTNVDFINIIHNIEMLYETEHTNRTTRLIQTFRNELDFPFEATEDLSMETVAFVLYYYTKDLGFDMSCSDSIILEFDNNKQLSENVYIPYAWCLENKILTSIEKTAINDKNSDFINSYINTTKSWNKFKELRMLNLDESMSISELEIILIQYLEYLASTKTPMEEVVDYGRQFLGVDYIYGGSSPDGFDCSGFVHYVFSNCGYDIGQRSGATSLVRNNGKSIKKSCLNDEGNIDWNKVPIGSVICFDWDYDKQIEHVGIWTGESLLHASGSPSKQYARNGYMVCEFFEGNGDGKKTSRSYKFGDYWKSHVIDIVSFED